MKKKIMAACMCTAMLAVAVVGGTMAYFTDTEKADNVFTVGNVDITLTEPNWEGEGSKDAPEAYPGEALAKDPTVENTGKNPCFVRIKVDGWDCLGEDNMITYRTDYVADKLGDNWELYDGYFYYNTVLNTGDKTDALFDQIVIPATVTNGFDDEYELVVTAEAVQAQGARPGWDKPEGDPMYPGVLQMNVEQIAAWFNTCMN